MPDKVSSEEDCAILIIFEGMVSELNSLSLFPMHGTFSSTICFPYKDEREKYLLKFMERLYDHYT